MGPSLTLLHTADKIDGRERWKEEGRGSKSEIKEEEKVFLSDSGGVKRGKGRKRSEAIAIVSALDRNTKLENTDR